MHNFQSMRPLGEDVKNVEAFYELGLRQMNFTYNIDLPNVADGGLATRPRGRLGCRHVNQR